MYLALILKLRIITNFKQYRIVFKDVALKMLLIYFPGFQIGLSW